MCIQMLLHSVSHDKMTVSPTGGSIKQEKAELYNRGKFLETPTLTSQSLHRNTPPTLSCQRGLARWQEKVGGVFRITNVIGRGRGRTRVEKWKSLHWCLKWDCFILWGKCPVYLKKNLHAATACKSVLSDNVKIAALQRENASLQNENWLHTIGRCDELHDWFRLPSITRAH